MQNWIISLTLYALGMGLFHILGGFGAAARALKEWGARSSIENSRLRSSR
jgi:hypothetical protein